MPSPRDSQPSTRYLIARRARVAAVAAIALFAAACSDDDGSGPETLPSGSLAVIVQDESAPPLAAVETSFWAVRGDDREVRLYYALRPGSTERDEFLRLRVRDGSLLARPDGSIVAMGDSVRITV